MHCFAIPQLILLTLFALKCSCQSLNVLPFLALNATDGVETEEVGHFDDGVSHTIHIRNGFPFGTSLHTFAFVGTNGIISFNVPFYDHESSAFPGANTDVSSANIVAPFWDDVDIRRRGNVFYEVHSLNTSTKSVELLNQVSEFISNKTSSDFHGNWMLLAEWRAVPPWPNGESQSDVDLLFPFYTDLYHNNTFQALLITDGESSYTIFTYQCGLMDWSRFPTIGFNAAGVIFENHPNTGSIFARGIACLNQPISIWYNVMYRVTTSSNTTRPPPPTIEPPQSSYLPFLSYEPSNNLSHCMNCSSSPITPPSRFPFGSYTHEAIYVGTNGIISFGEPYSYGNPALFPTQSIDTYYKYVVAPFWSDIDTRLEGEIYYHTFQRDESSSSNQLLDQVTSFINSERDTDFSSNWMLAARWNRVHPFPHGESVEQDRQDPYLQSSNTFEGIVITNGTKSYAVFTYQCPEVEWSDGAVIGFNAGFEYFGNHPLSGLVQSSVIDCVHPNVEWNNVIFDLTPGDVRNESTPTPPNTIGSCVKAGYTECCSGDADSCLGNAGDCYCDVFCGGQGDCCVDQATICDSGTISTDESYLLFTNGRFVSRTSLDGQRNTTRNLIEKSSGGVFGIDYDYSRQYMYWSDTSAGSISRAFLNGSDVQQIANTTIDIVEDLALDWINNKLYWTESVHRRIEVLDLDTMYRTPLINAAPHTGLRSIVVDPLMKYMYWTDWGTPAKIERASMDGNDRKVLLDTELVQPNGITIDLLSQIPRIYWVDGSQQRIEYSNFDGTARNILVSGLLNPFAITLEGALLYWTDWQNFSIYSTHKFNSNGPQLVLNNIQLDPRGIEAVNPHRQPSVPNPCDANTCEHICLLSSIDSRGYSCACAEGFNLDLNGQNCTMSETTTATPTVGSCVAAGFNSSECCVGGYCAGSPPTCYCDRQCHVRGDCCDDVTITCPRISSCRLAGYDSCCIFDFFALELCQGVSEVGSCACDEFCRTFDDCCDDFDEICPLFVPTPAPTTEATTGSSGVSTNEPPTVTTATEIPGLNVLPFLALNATDSVETEEVGHFDDGVSHAILVPQGFHFGNTLQNIIFISINGIISFGEPFYSALPTRFPSVRSDVSNAYIIAPYWDDVDLRQGGNIFYEIHSLSSGNPGSLELIQNVSAYIREESGEEFEGSWMLLVEWREVHPWPHGLNPLPLIFAFFYPDYILDSTWQALIITDGQESYSVFTYRCGSILWSRSTSIGFNAAGVIFENYLTIGGLTAVDIACLNVPRSNWTNVVYKLTSNSSGEPILPPTVEPPQSSYLPFLEVANTSSTFGVLPPCQNCSSPAISIPNSGFPFGDFYHSTVYVGTNGVFSFNREFRQDSPEAFPSTDLAVQYEYLVTPFWSNVDTRLSGQVRYIIQSVGETSGATDFQPVVSFINSEQDPEFTNAKWMLVAMWDQVHPFPHGESASVERQDPYLKSSNTFQGILITNGTKSYSIFTYVCDMTEWSDEATIGFNAGLSSNNLHFLSGTLQASAIDCVHQQNGSNINNVIFDLVPGELMQGTPPQPPASLGSCVAANYTSCCEDDDCRGVPADCFCDEFCSFIGDCCEDIATICTTEEPVGNDTYLIFGNLEFVNRVNLDGGNFHILTHQPGSNIIGIDFDYRRDYLYWSEVLEDRIFRSSLNGSDPVVLVNTGILSVDDIAVDWVGNNLYWTDSVYARLEVLDLDSMERAELFRTGANTVPRAIAVDPSTRYMYWTDWGSPAKIERASMDGKNRTVLHSTQLVWPNGLTIDYGAQTIYWIDANLDKIEYSNVDGTGRRILITVSFHPFSITLEGNLLFWTDWSFDTIFTAHKTSGVSIGTVYSNLRNRPYGIEAITPDRQAPMSNPCANNPCSGSSICLLSAVVAEGYSCKCPEGYGLANATSCVFVGTVPPPEVGSCAAAAYNACCISGSCAGSPPTCYCDSNCRDRGDCCPDVNSTCPESGSCRAAGYEACCSAGTCRGFPSNCRCDGLCTFFGDCCDDHSEVCTGGFPGSCIGAGYTNCCDDGSDCFGSPSNCKCDAGCRNRSDCCASDISVTCPVAVTSTAPTVTMVPLPTNLWLPFLNLSSTPGITTMFLGRLDDGNSDPIPIPTGFPFGNAVQTVAHVGTNGVLSFREPFTQFSPLLFPSESASVFNSYVLAPFWSDVDNTVEGNIFYETHFLASNNTGSELLLRQVSDFVSNTTGNNFTGTWMLVVQWDHVRPYPAFTNLELENTYQAIAITDGTKSYAVYTYQCGLMEWSDSATIGYNGGRNYFANHPLSGSPGAQTIACVNSPENMWSNVVYNLTTLGITPTSLPPTSETPPPYVLPFLEDTGINRHILNRCDDCTSDAIDLSGYPVPFGNYYHYSVHVASNGIISFGDRFLHYEATPLPNPNDASVFYSYLVAPYWSDVDYRLVGEISYEVHSGMQNETSARLLELVSTYVNNITDETTFSGQWMLVATWDEVHQIISNNPNILNPESNTYQAIIITNGTKTYAIFTYQCDLVLWSDSATIGFNAAGDYFDNHPLSSSTLTDQIDCVHLPTSVWNNVIFDLVPNPEQLNNQSVPTPRPQTSFGLCLAVYGAVCCEIGTCEGSDPSDCFCDVTCHQFGDCCSDIDQTCPNGPLPGTNDTYLLVANTFTINRLNVNGTSFESLLPVDFEASYFAVDYDYRRDVLYYSETRSNRVIRSWLNGSNPVVLIDDINSDLIDDLAVDWIGNNLYWTESIYRRVEVLDLDTMNRKILIQTDTHTAPRAIAVDPINRYMYWSDWGDPAKIERASMDGSSRTVLHYTGIVWPNGLTLDYEEQRIYWLDANLDKIEYSNLDGSGRTLLESEAGGLVHPFSLTLDGSILYWSDWQTNSIYMTHKVIGQTILPLGESLLFRPNVIEVVSPTHQQQGSNPCDRNSCSHMCLLSATSTQGFTCACPQGATLMDDGRTCDESTVTPTTPTPEEGSCRAAGYTSCCTGGFCAGFPPSCFCDVDCGDFFDCCSDFDGICGATSTTSIAPTTAIMTTRVPMSSTSVGTISSTSLSTSTGMPIITPGTTNPHKNSNGGAIAGGLIVAVVLILLLLMVVVIVLWVLRRRSKVHVGSYDVFENEGVSQSPSINNDLKAKEAENEYETLPGTLASGKKQELAFNSDNGDTVLTGYQTVGGELPAFDNPLYDTVLAKDSSTSSNPSNGDYENSKGNFKYDKLKEEVV